LFEAGWLDDLPALGLAAGDLYDRLEAGGQGDGLPVAVPSPGWIDAALAAAGHHPDLELGRIPPLRLPVTAHRLAVCAALAGCRPEHYPVVAAAVTALEHPDLNTLGVLTTTGSATFALWVNGPAGPRLGFNAGGNLLGPGSRANATVGRALSLATRILAGARQGVGDMATMGQPAKYTLAFAENEAESPWEPFHVERGFAPADSALSVLGVAGSDEVVDAWAMSNDEIVAALAHALVACAGAVVHGDGTLGGGQPLLLISPEWANRLAVGGMGRRELRARLASAAVTSPDRLPASALRGVEAEGAALPDVLRVVASADDVLVVVAGGVGLKQAILPNWNGRSRAVTVPLT
jgi:hypothetical protein